MIVEKYYTNPDDNIKKLLGENMKLKKKKKKATSSYSKPASEARYVLTTLCLY